MKVALFEPDIPQNLGSLVRLCACLDVELHVIEPCGFIWDERRLRKVALDYIDHAKIVRHASFSRFEDWRLQASCRLVLLTTKTKDSYVDFAFSSADILLLGRESAGVTEEVRQAADAALTIPIQAATRSLNIAMAGAMVLSEALRQTHSFPERLHA